MRKSKLLDLGSELISRIFDPVWEIPLALLLAVSVAMQEGLRWRFVGLLLFVDVIVPMVFFLVMLLNKQIKDWDIQERAQRIPLYLFTMLCHLVGLWLAHELGRSELFNILLVYYVVAIVFFGVTLFWKISIHLGVNAVLITTLNVFADYKYWYLYGILLLVAWARMYQKHHSGWQALAGAVLGSVIIYVGLTALV